MSKDDDEITGVHDLPYQIRGFATKVVIEHRQLRNEFNDHRDDMKALQESHGQVRNDMGWIKGALKVALGLLAALLVHAVSTHIIK